MNKNDVNNDNGTVAKRMIDADDFMEVMYSDAITDEQRLFADKIRFAVEQYIKYCNHNKQFRRIFKEELMTYEKAADIIRNEIRCVMNNCDRNCHDCPLVLPERDIVEALGIAINALEIDVKKRKKNKIKKRKRRKEQELVYEYYDDV